MGLVGWSWFFLFGYILMMVVFGFVGQRKVDSADDFRQLVGPMALFFSLLLSPLRRPAGLLLLGFPELVITQDYP